MYAQLIFNCFIQEDGPDYDIELPSPVESSSVSGRPQKLHINELEVSVATLCTCTCMASK